MKLEKSLRCVLQDKHGATSTTNVAMAAPTAERAVASAGYCLDLAGEQLFAQTTMALTRMNARGGTRHDLRINREQRLGDGQYGLKSREIHQPANPHRGP